MILALLNYHAWSSEFRNKAEEHLQSLLKYYPQGHNAMRQLLIYFEQNETVIPSYRIFQDMFSSAFAVESQRLADIVATIPVAFQRRLNAFNRNNNGITDLNLVGLEPKDFQCMAMREEAEKAQRIIDLYEFAVIFIPRLHLARNAVCYYAEITEDYPAARLRKLKQPQQWLHALCFVYQRYQQIMNNLISGFLYRVRMLQEAGTEAAERAFAQYQARLSLNFPGAAKFIAWFPNRNKHLSYEEVNNIAYDMLPESEFSSFSKFLEGLDFDKKAAKWTFYAEQSQSS